MSSQPEPSTSLPGQTDPNAKVSAEHASGLSALQRKRAELAAKLKAEKEAAAASASIEEEEEAVASFTAANQSIDDKRAQIIANKAEITVQEDISTADESTPEQIVKAEKKVKILEKRNVALEDDITGDEEKTKVDWAKLGDASQTAVGVALLGTTVGSLLKGQPDVPTPPSAGDTARELSSVTADREFGINQQLANYGPGLAVDALQDADLAAEWQAAGSPDFNSWVQSVMSDPTSPTARKLADMLDPLNVEAKERGRRIDEAANFYNEYDASQFQSPEMQAAQSYASGLTSDPLSMRNRQYMEQELAGDYSQGWYDDLRSDLFSSMHPGAVGNSIDMAQAALGAEDAIRRRRDAASDRIARDDALRMSYAPSYASIAASGSADPLSLSNVGKMGIGNIEPMDPTGAFFGSFPAMEYDTNLAAYQKQPTTIQTLTALGQAAQQFKK